MFLFVLEKWPLFMALLVGNKRASPSGSLNSKMRKNVTNQFNKQHKRKKAFYFILHSLDYY